MCTKNTMTMLQQSSNHQKVNLGYLLTQSAYIWRRAVARALLPYGLTPPQFFLLMSIYRQQLHEDRMPNQRQAAAHTTMDVNVASQITKKLIARKLVDRHVDPKDSRAYVLSLTTDGIALAKESSAMVRACNDVFFADSNPQYLAEELQKIIKE